MTEAALAAEVAKDVMARMETVEVSRDLLASIIERTEAKAPGFTMVPKDMKEAKEYAEVISKSKLCPKDYQGKIEDIVIAIMYGMELGLKPLQALACIAVINGRAAIWGDGALAVVLASGLVEDFKELCGSDALAAGAGRCIIKRRGQASPVDVSFTVDDAKTAGLWTKEGPWHNYPGRMLQMRARGFALRDKFADVLKGLVFVEETNDYQDGAIGPKTEAAIQETLKAPQRRSDAAKTAPAAPAPAQDQAKAAASATPAGGSEGSCEVLIEKVEVIGYKDAKTGADKRFFKLTAAGGQGYATFSDTEADVARSSMEKKTPVAISWKRSNGKDNLAVKSLSPVMAASQIPDEPGSNG